MYTQSLLDRMLAIASNHEFVIFYSTRTDIGRFRHLSNVKEIFVAKLLWDQVVTPYHAVKQGVIESLVESEELMGWPRAGFCA